VILGKTAETENLICGNCKNKFIPFPSRGSIPGIHTNLFFWQATFSTEQAITFLILPDKVF